MSMEEFIERLRNLAKVIPTNTKENRAIKGAYVHCIQIAKEYIKKNRKPSNPQTNPDETSKD